MRIPESSPAFPSFTMSNGLPFESAPRAADISQNFAKFAKILLDFGENPW
jgi:hypothetical protein